ncbi:hypothetical protein C0R02_09390 [Streptomyces albidoflavus]|nr:hypothetical protein C0R02_09390 [Streptomyces albidoflavus]
MLQLATKIHGGRSVFSPPTGGTTPTKRKGGDGSGCPRSKLHTRPLKRLTPHHAVCEEAPRPPPARPTRGTNREPHSPAGA